MQSTANRPVDYETRLVSRSPVRQRVQDSSDSSDEESDDDDTHGGGGVEALFGAGKGGARLLSMVAEGSENRKMKEEERRRKELRNVLLQEQLKPAGHFRVNADALYSASDGSVAYIDLLHERRRAETVTANANNASASSQVIGEATLRESLSALRLAAEATNSADGLAAQHPS